MLIMLPILPTPIINTLHDMVYYFNLVFNCPHLEACCKIVSSVTSWQVSQKIDNISHRKIFSSSWSYQIKGPTIQPGNPWSSAKRQLIYCGEQVEIDILMISTPTSSIPKAAGGFKYLVLVFHAFSPFLSYVPITLVYRNCYQ